MPSPRESILVVDDEPGICRLLQEVLGDAGYRVCAHQNPAEALKAFEREPFDLVISDIRMPRLTGIDVLKSVKERAPGVPVILVTAFGSTRTAVEAMKLGTSDFIAKPFKNEEIRLVVEGVLERRRLVSENLFLRRELAVRDGLGAMAGVGEPMAAVFRSLAEASDSDVPVLLEGPAGTGKELAARTIHLRSRRAASPFVAVDCAALQADEAEKRLFGGFEGLFPGTRGKEGAGLLAAAGGGTVYLESVGALSMPAQAGLLRLLQEGKVRRIGAVEKTPVDVRVIASSRGGLREDAEQGRFRMDLYRRLAALAVGLPGLKDRPADIPVLAGLFLERAAKRLGRPGLNFSAEAVDAMAAYPWPGNVTELEAVVERAAPLAEDGRVGRAALPPGVLQGAPAPGASAHELRPFREAKQEVVDAFEKSYLTRLLAWSDGNVTRAAGSADMDRKNFYELLKKHGLAPRPAPPPPA